MKKITIFTPTYNRRHTIWRTYESMLRQTCHDLEWMIIDDGSTDGTREWVESLGKKFPSAAKPVDWMGRAIEESKSLKVEEPKSSGDEASERTSCIEVPFADSEDTLKITYIYKDNGGLYTGYNTAYANIETELCVCIDSDDYMPDDAVEKILKLWGEAEPEKYCGIVGLDFNVVDKQPIGGWFEGEQKKCIGAFFQNEMNHSGDTKQVFRTGLMKQVSPMIGFEGERDFNPHYMQIQVLDRYPILVLNDNLCWVEYQTTGDSMSGAIYKQFIRSPKSYAKSRLMEMSLNHGISRKRRIALHIHYVSSCIFAKNSDWLKRSPAKIMTLLAAPFGLLLSIYIKIKAR